MVNPLTAGVGALLTRYNFEAGRQDTVAKAITAIEENAQVYTQFEIDFDYLIPGLSPDTIIIVLTSSGDGGNFQGQIGSTLIVDDLSLEYPAGLLESLLPELEVSVFPSPAAERVTFKFDTSHPEKLRCDVYALEGRLARSFSPYAKEHKMDVSAWPQGKYILQVYEGSTLVSSAKFIVAH